MPALPAVAGIDLVILGLVALLLAVALFPLFRPLLAGGLSTVPVIGGWLSGNVDLVLFRAYVSALGAIAAAIEPLADFLRRVRWATSIHASWVGYTLGAVLATVTRIRTLYIPAAQQAAMSYAEGRVGWLTVYAQTLYWQAIDFAAGQGRAAVAYAEGRVGWLTVYAQTLYWQAVTLARSEVQALAAQVLQIVTAEQLATRQALDLEQRYAEQLYGRAIESGRQAAAEAEAYARLQGSTAEAYARALSELVRSDAAAQSAAVAAGAAAATAQVASAVRAIEESPCQRFCSPLGDVGGLLEHLADAGMAAILVELAVEMASHPQETARALDGTVGTLVRGGIDDVSGAAGLAAGGLGAFTRVGGPVRPGGRG